VQRDLHLYGCDTFELFAQPRNYVEKYICVSNATPDALTKLLIRATVGTRAKGVKQIMQKRENGEKTQRLLRYGN
jgi:hypothetical protein